MKPILSWLTILAVTVTLAVLFLLALPSGAPLWIAAHVGLLVGGSAVVLALAPPEHHGGSTAPAVHGSGRGLPS